MLPNLSKLAIGMDGSGPPQPPQPAADPDQDAGTMEELVFREMSTIMLTQFLKPERNEHGFTKGHKTSTEICQWLQTLCATARQTCSAVDLYEVALRAFGVNTPRKREWLALNVLPDRPLDPADGVALFNAICNRMETAMDHLEQDRAEEVEYARASFNLENFEQTARDRLENAHGRYSEFVREQYNNDIAALDGLASIGFFDAVRAAAPYKTALTPYTPLSMVLQWRKIMEWPAYLRPRSGSYWRVVADLRPRHRPYALRRALDDMEFFRNFAWRMAELFGAPVDPMAAPVLRVDDPADRDPDQGASWGADHWLTQLMLSVLDSDGKPQPDGTRRIKWSKFKNSLDAALYPGGGMGWVQPAVAERAAAVQAEHDRLPPKFERFRDQPFVGKVSFQKAFNAVRFAVRLLGPTKLSVDMLLNEVLPGALEVPRIKLDEKRKRDVTEMFYFARMTK